MKAQKSIEEIVAEIKLSPKYVRLTHNEKKAYLSELKKIYNILNAYKASMEDIEVILKFTLRITDLLVSINVMHTDTWDEVLAPSRINKLWSGKIISCIVDFEKALGKAEGVPHNGL